jgi:hypothetical protein
MASRWRRWHDGDQNDEGISETWTTPSIVSRCEVEGRLETVRRWGGSADDAYVASLRDLGGEGYQSGCRREGRSLGRERGARAHRRCSNRRRTAAEASDSDEESLCGSSMILRRSKGRWRRSARAFYRRRERSKRPGIYGNWRGGINRGKKQSPARFPVQGGRRLTWPDIRGPHVGEGERIGCTDSGLGWFGPWTETGVGPKGFPEVLFLFSFLFFFFFFYFFFLILLHLLFKWLQTNL